MPSILPFPTPAQPEARIKCPTCAAPPAKRIDSHVGDETVAACLCPHGHLFVIQWRPS